MELLLDPQVWIAFVTLTALEIVLGIDNIIFISILVGRLPAAQRARARLIGFSAAMLTRILLLVSLTWVMGLTATFFTVAGVEISGRDLILILGGAFLIAKSTSEIHDSLEGTQQHRRRPHVTGYTAVLVQIALIDIVFSLDSVITAIGLVRHVEVMIAAIVVAVLIMMVSAGAIGTFVDRHPTVKMLALAFLILIGVALVADGLDLHIPKGYLYFAMAFSVAVELLNLRVRRAARPVRLHKKRPR